MNQVDLIALIHAAPAERLNAFHSNVAVGGDDECWNWQGGTTGDGYGVFKIGRWWRTSAHRIAYALAKGDPGRAHVCHRCDNPLCCNPKHLWLGTPKSNAEDKVQKGRARGRFSLKGSSVPSAPVSDKELSR